MIEFNSRVDKSPKIFRSKLSRANKARRTPASERSLCSLFGVGRTTIREALKSLAVRGLVTRSARGA